MGPISSRGTKRRGKEIVVASMKPKGSSNDHKVKKYFFLKDLTHMKNNCPKYREWRIKKVMDENTRIRWTNEIIKCFLETCIDEVNKVGRNGGSLRKDTWTKLAAKLEEICHVKLTQKQLKNQYDYLKGKYSGWVYLRNKTGNIYDPVMNTFTLSNQEWEDFFKGHPKAKTLKTSPLAFPDLCIALFEGTSATGSRVYAPSSTRERTVVLSSSFTSHIHSTQNEEEDDEDEGSNVDIPNADPATVSPIPHSSKPNKKRAKVDMDELAWDMKGALHTFVTRQVPPVVPSPTTTLDACIERLNTLGLDPSDPLYQAAIDIFGHTTLLRETWLINSPDPKILKDWIIRTARRLGFI